MFEFTVVLSPDRNAGGYSVTIPAMLGAVTEGDTREAALGAAAEVMAAWMEVAQRHGDAPLAETLELIAAQIASVIEDRDLEGWDRTETTVIHPAVAVA
jgi:predicted RNase H-like HicB family nuclease